MKVSRLPLALGLAAGLFAGAALPARADVFVLKDGTEIDGLVIRETDDTIYVRLLTDGVEKLAVADVQERRPGKSAVERAKELEAAIKSDKKDVGSMWELWQIYAPHEDKGLVKKRDKLMEKLLEVDPDHADARAARGDVKFEGRWVAKSDLAAVQAEAERAKVKKYWKDKLGVDFELYETEHYTFLDAHGEKDLIGRAEAMERAHDALKEVLQRKELWRGRCVVITFPNQSLYLESLETFQKQWQMPDWWMKAARANTGVWRQIPDPVIMRYTGESEDLMWSAIIHSTAHLSMWTYFRSKVPAWLEEGLGAWVEMEVTDEHMTSCVGTTAKSKGHTTDKRPGKKGKGKGKDLKETSSLWREIFLETLGNGDFATLRAFMNMGLGEFDASHEGGALALVSYLISKGSDKFGQAVAELKAVKGEKNTDAVWKNVYGFEVVEEMEKDWKGWVLSAW